MRKLIINADNWVKFVAIFFKSFIMERAPSLQPLAPLSLQVIVQGTEPNQSIAFQFLRGQPKSYGLLEVGTAPELTMNRVSSFNLSSFLSNSPENLTLDSIPKKSFRSFLAFVQ